jgi:hypothetical protein
MIEMLKKVHERSDELKICDEVAYLLHCRRINNEYERKNASLEGQLNLLQNSYS